jgi:hypothetical protein
MIHHLKCEFRGAEVSPSDCRLSFRTIAVGFGNRAIAPNRPDTVTIRLSEFQGGMLGVENFGSLLV